MEKLFNTMSFETKLDGIISTMHTHTPITQDRLMSLDVFRRTIRTMRGMLNNGIETPATMPIVFHMGSSKIGFSIFGRRVSHFHIENSLRKIDENRLIFQIK